MTAPLLLPLPSGADPAFTTALPDEAVRRFGPAAAGFPGGLLPPLPPQPVGVPRRRLNLPFAVLLLASGYDVADGLDFIAMDAFQRVFWLQRQSEWEPYTLQYAPVRITQGDLADPQYFDFIAGVQASAVATAMRAGQQTFKEYCGEECPPGGGGPGAGEGIPEGYRLTTRDPALQDNAALPARYEARLGDALYRRIAVDGFRGTVFGGPAPLGPGASPAELIAGVRALLRVFVDNGFCINAEASDPVGGPDGAGFTFTIRLDGPATLWALQSMAARRAELYPVYTGLASAGFLRACGRQASCSFAWTESTVTERITVV